MVIRCYLCGIALGDGHDEDGIELDDLNYCHNCYNRPDRDMRTAHLLERAAEKEKEIAKHQRKKSKPKLPVSDERLLLIKKCQMLKE
ncbi:MAG: hypothetical protein PHI12_12210 [Dehalococcoidales bacterium]|nr:hypothetical protein [Dehalococcoidales bacterium]